ncbi:hypothetical protein L228DRAFT_40378 [Xylona heveae TC161]|uniref:DUF7820 domain-containing protein n=1 Tax=Xylona heveae (strain CBS 132557 / TC161) TaxID=1328760 RepID=A0A165A051_XYLHT|nr:hypothetical protein L228DRAFT_40378 [Xylona heveae TC161]KZF19764.1 hypothetical protein L228DRAFT_40378 [Xylona heveae TC161]
MADRQPERPPSSASRPASPSHLAPEASSSTSASSSSTPSSTSPTAADVVRLPSQTSNPNVFDDEFAIESADVTDNSAPVTPIAAEDPSSISPVEAAAIVDGPMRPQRPAEEITPIASPPVSKAQEAAQETGLASDATTPAAAAASANAQGPKSHFNFQMPPPMGQGRPASPGFNPDGTPRRPASIASSFQMPRAQSPYQGATGPSHPYDMYPQGIGLPRSPSLSSASNVRTSRVYTGPNGPTHPYGMYPQNTIPEGTDGLTSHIPVGFPGVAQQTFTRPLGPSAEGADDIVGPDGHTEQLPPYTRYPDGHQPSPVVNTHGLDSAAAAGAAGAAAGTDAAATHALPGADAGTPVTMSPSPQERIQPQTSETQTTLVEPDHSGSFKEKLTEKSKHRVCWGKVPMWLFAVSIALIVIFAAILGGVVGGLVSNENRHSAQQASQQASAAAASATRSVVTVTASSSSWNDFSPLSSTPTNLPTLASGTYVVPMPTAQVDSSACLIDNNQSSAWSCNVGGDLFELLYIAGGPGKSNFAKFITPGDTIQYGAQPPSIGQPQMVNLVTDNDAANLGPAYFFRTQAYDKVVVVPEEQFPQGSSSKQRRSASPIVQRSSANFTRYTDIVRPNEKPWFCFWNGTMLDVFIYLYENSSVAAWDNAAASAAAKSSGHSSTTTITTTYNSYPSGMAPTSTTSSLTTTSDTVPWPSQFNDFPKRVKAIERRQEHNAIQPYCQQMQMLDDWSIQPAQENGSPVTFLLNETEPEPSPTTAAFITSVTARRRRWDDGPEVRAKRSEGGATWKDGCFCEWLSS